jgi:hypothetical protein
MLTHSTVGKNVQQYLHPEGTNNRPATGNVNRMIKMLSKVQANIYMFFVRCEQQLIRRLTSVCCRSSILTAWSDCCSPQLRADPNW